ncbi:SGNH family hydrolase [Notoacmeibacter sp. MSK16QG-6]|uniref:SGNH/GDSL hydrolase family protein n=1 Tax=Notoacmeibacter sp. MSK16QG-6 TaxID=2957982 RepID=UPI0020A0341C|nr:SGNH family hydrolase [Notoacmeibacter sp. MSK16QG-6]MCP1200364.1 DUF459 domain-containing protein [Notoacmeibacter sp. MSK16QG-6]
MTPALIRRQMRSSARFLIAGILALAVVVCGDGLILSKDAQAENFFSKILRGSDGRNAAQSRQELRQKRVRRAKPRTAKRRRSVTRKRQPVIAKPATPQRETVQKADDAKKVLVVGDFMAGNLADGLAEILSDRAGILIVERDNGSSGLVRDDYYDWPTQLAQILQEEEPDVLIVMIGANDRQAMRVDGRARQVRSTEWNNEYRERVEAIASLAGEADVPLIWVGQPSYKFTSMNTDMLAFNETYRTVVEAAQGRFVDVWEGFVDQDSNFVFTGPDVKGQMARLRASDGINMTSAGDEKLAFYVEKALDEALSGLISGNPPVLAAPNEGLAQPEVTSLTRTQVYKIGDPELDGADGLFDVSISQGSADDAASVTSGLPPRAPTGRASDFGGASRLPADGVREKAGQQVSVSPDLEGAEGSATVVTTN